MGITNEDVIAGLRHVAALLGAPGVEFKAVELHLEKPETAALGNEWLTIRWHREREGKT